MAIAKAKSPAVKKAPVAKKAMTVAKKATAPTTAQRVIKPKTVSVKADSVQNAQPTTAQRVIKPKKSASSSKSLNKAAVALKKKQIPAFSQKMRVLAEALAETQKWRSSAVESLRATSKEWDRLNASFTKRAAAMLQNVENRAEREVTQAAAKLGKELRKMANDLGLTPGTDVSIEYPVFGISLCDDTPPPVSYKKKRMTLNNKFGFGGITFTGDLRLYINGTETVNGAVEEVSVLFYPGCSVTIHS